MTNLARLISDAARQHRFIMQAEALIYGKAMTEIAYRMEHLKEFQLMNLLTNL